MFADIYNGKRAFITGHTGFKGSWLSAWLIALGARVTGFSKNVPTKPACFEELELEARLESMTGDVRDLDALKSALASAKPDVVFHLAAQALVRESYRDPLGTITTNAIGTLNLLEAARQCDSIKAIAVITSDKCYRNDEWVWGYRETDHLGGADPYSASKGCAELISHSYFASFFQSGAACATARAGNVIGGGDWAADRIVPDCARAWAAGKRAQIRSPRATRPWQHVLEPLSGYLWLCARLLDNEAGGPSAYAPRGQSYNFGPPADAIHSVAEVASGLKRHWPGFDYEIDADGACAMKECGLLKLCCDKALAELDWKATLDFDETIRFAADWYARYHAGAGPGAMWNYTQGQIAAYCRAAENRDILWARS